MHVPQNIARATGTLLHRSLTDSFLELLRGRGPHPGTDDWASREMAAIEARWMSGGVSLSALGHSGQRGSELTGRPPAGRRATVLLSSQHRCPLLVMHGESGGAAHAGPVPVAAPVWACDCQSLPPPTRACARGPGSCRPQVGTPALH